MRKLIVCAACERHVRVEESVCPFCGAPCESEGAQAPAGTRLRGRPGGRAALFLAGVAATAGCDKDEEEEMPVPVYGVPVDASGMDAATEEGGVTTDAGDDAMVAPVYGVPVDAGAEQDASSEKDASADDDAGQVAPAYGVPIDAGEDANDPVDAGDAEIMVVPLYGLPVDTSK